MIARTHESVPDKPRGTDSHAAPAKPRPQPADPRVAADLQNGLDVRADLPLHLKTVLT